MDNHFKKYGELNAKNLEKISDEFAIEFAEWTWDKDLTIIKDTNIYTRKELLEIFKKEKGL